MIRKTIDRVYAKSRQTKIPLDPNLGTVDLVNFVLEKFVCALRGLIVLRHPSFLGRNIKLRGRRRIRLGQAVSISDYVELNAVGLGGIELGDNVTVDRSAILRVSGVLRELGEGIAVGSRTSIGSRNFIWGQGGVEIGTDCLLGPDVTILSEHHLYDADVPIRDQGTRRMRTVIGDDVWLGARCVILPGISIGDGAVIAAGSVVSKSVQPGQVVAGVPARLLKART